LLIPIGTKHDFNYDHKKNNVCKICRYNCLLECKYFKKRFCKKMSFKFKCKVCSNKCLNNCYEVSPIVFSKCEYRTIAPNDNDYDIICLKEIYPLLNIFGISGTLLPTSGI
jgi:hypothetical protein